MGVLKARVGGSWVPVTQGYSSTRVGVIAALTPTGNQSFSTAGAWADVVGLSTPLTILAGRTYLVTAQYYFQKTVAVGGVGVGIFDGSNNALNNATTTVGTVDGYGSGVCHYIIKDWAPQTITLKGRVYPGTNGVVVFGSGSALSNLIVEDITQVQPADTSLVGAWTPVTFQNAWLDLGGGYQTCQYRKIGDIVYLRGVAKSGSSGTVAFTLPVGYRPPLALEIASMGATVFARFAVNPDGTVIFYGSPNFWLVGSFSVTA